MSSSPAAASSGCGPPSGSSSATRIDVVILERDICGGGASGRNGGFALSWWPKLSSLTKLCGSEEALRLGHASAAAIDEFGGFCEEHAIEADFRRGGFLWTATTPAHIGAWEGVVSRCERLGVNAFERLEPAEIARRPVRPSISPGFSKPERRRSSRPCWRGGCDAWRSDWACASTSTRRSLASTASVRSSSGPGRARFRLRSSSSRRMRGLPGCPS